MLKKMIFPVLLLILMIMTGCASGTMVKLDTPPSLSVGSDMALLVIYRPTRYSGSQETEIFMDNELVGTTTGMQAFVVPVKPGKHYFMAVGENENITRINVAAGKVYFIGQYMYPGVFRNRTEVFIKTREEFNADQANLDWYVIDAEARGQTYEGWDDLVKQLEEDIANNPKMYERFLNMQGY